MADTAIAITQGSGTNIDTRTESTNGNHRQVVVLGDPATNAGVAPVDATNGLSVTLTTALPAGSAAIGKLAANSGVDIGDVDVTTVGTITPGTAATNLGKAEDAAHTSGDVGVMALAVSNEANTARAADGDYLPIATDTEGNVRVVGNRDSDAVDAGEPVKVGGQARTTNPTAVADADRVNFIADKLGKQVVVGSVRDLKANQVTTITSSTSETTIVTAVASTFLDLYGLIVTNTSATAVNVAIKDATAGTTRLNIAVPAGETRGFMLPESGAIKQSATNNNWTATSSGSVASLVITALTVANT